LFATRGLDVPLSAIAQDAGVGQGVLYRHFPARIDLALAIFEENFARIDAAVAAEARPEHRLEVAWEELVELMISDIGFVETFTHSWDDERADALHDQVMSFLVPLIHDAGQADKVCPDLGVEDVLLVLRAVYGLAATRPHGDPAVRTEVEALVGALIASATPLRPS
jgi:AcrR family transcriptional regulator